MMRLGMDGAATKKTCLALIFACHLIDGHCCDNVEIQ
jgi:hypothetical protein